MLTIINPATEEKISALPVDDAHSVLEKFARLKKGQPQWSTVALPARIACIQRFHDLLETEKDELAHTLTREMGKPVRQSYNELNGARNRIGFFLRASEEWLGEEWIDRDAGTSEKISYEPLGIIANISAWNYPYLVGVNVFVPALIGGNAVMYKPSEYATLTGLKIMELLYRSGIPENVFQVAVGGGDTGALLLDLPFDGYFFTGSYWTGRHIAVKVAERMVPCQLELGGKDPLYVMDDITDIDAVAAAALEGVVYNNGQSCCAVERIYVQDKVYDRFVASIVAQADQLKVGDPNDAATDMGPLSRKAQLQLLHDQVNDAKSKGAKVLNREKHYEGRGYFMYPVIMGNVDHSMRLMKEESFGPVIGIQRVKDDDEAANLMLDSEYGLTAAIYSSDFGRAEKLMRRMDTGTVYWNCCDRVSAGLPWSGRKHSGIGSTLSYSGIRAFVRPKAWHMRKPG